MLFRQYEDYLESLGRKPGSVRIYSRCLRRVLPYQCCPEEMLSLVNELIAAHAKGGNAYDPKDHGNTAAALRHLKNMLLEPYAQKLCVTYDAGYTSFPLKEEHVHAYRISDYTITVEYYAGFCPTRTVEKKISHKRFHELVELMLKNRHLLAPSDTAIKTVHGFISDINYVLEDTTEGTHCRHLFMSDTLRREASGAEASYSLWLSRCIKR